MIAIVSPGSLLLVHSAITGAPEAVVVLASGASKALKIAGKVYAEDGPSLSGAGYVAEYEVATNKPETIRARLFSIFIFNCIVFFYF
ncbi:hypothetical protein [Pontiella sp.]|uniref:hypothetical protein n=1 Tax=Pontiella sp. TaxID=2837462 RepID=UPI003565F53A